MEPENAVLSNLHDSVSRIVDNFQFTHIEQTAHARLVGLVAQKMTAMSETCRALLENSGRSGANLNADIDLKHLFRMHRVDLRDLVDYTQQVGAFPPRKFEIHGDESAELYRRQQNARLLDKENSDGKNEKNKKNNSNNSLLPPMRHPTPPRHSLPIYDDMSPSELGYNDDSDDDVIMPTTHSSSLEAPPPQISRSFDLLLPPPPPPPPLPPLSFYDLTSSSAPIMFDPISPPPPPSSSSNYSNPTYSNPEVAVKFKLFKADPPGNRRIEKYEKWPKHLMEMKPPKRSAMAEKRKIEVLAPKMTKKRLMQTNYERRLRNEQMALEEKKKEKILELKMKQQQKEKEKKWAGLQHEPLRKFKERLKKSTVVEKRDEKSSSHGRIQTMKKDENGNDKILMMSPPSTSSKIQKSDILTSSGKSSKEQIKNGIKNEKTIVNRAPLPKLRVLYRSAYQGRLIKKVETTEFLDIKGASKPVTRTWSNRQGIFSKTNYPIGVYECRGLLKPSLPTPRLPKLKLTKNADNSYSKIGFSF